MSGPTEDASARRLARDVPIKEVMQSRRVAHLPPTASVRRACEIMAMLEMGAVPVVEGSRMVGIFTERDAVTSVLARGISPEETSLAEVMTAPVVTVSPGSTVSEASRMMREKGFRHLPVVEGDRVLGIISLRDLMFEVCR